MKMKLLLLALLVVVVFISVEAVSYYDLVQEQWDEFKATHQKKYDDATEEKFRMKIYMENVHTIAKHNQLYAEGLVSFQMKANKYADMLPFEFTASRNGFNRNGDQLNRTGVTFLPAANVEIPDQIDWRDQGAVTPIKDQGNCGSCWSFSATGSLEGQNFRKTGQLVSLSEQNLIDCSIAYGNNGCDGGLMDYAFEYVIGNNGIDTESSYPYEANDDYCRYDAVNIGGTATGFVDLPSGDESQLQNAVATVGPISVAIDASHVSFQFYSDGIYYEPECSAQQLDHGVLVIGYGTDSQGDYWLVKNSWGTSWGANGYIKMSRNRGNNCGIATLSSYPLV